MVYIGDISIVNRLINQLITWGAPPCRDVKMWMCLEIGYLDFWLVYHHLDKNLIFWCCVPLTHTCQWLLSKDMSRDEMEMPCPQLTAGPYHELILKMCVSLAGRNAIFMVTNWVSWYGNAHRWAWRYDDMIIIYQSRAILGWICWWLCWCPSAVCISLWFHPFWSLGAPKSVQKGRMWVSWKPSYLESHFFQGSTSK